MRTLFMRNMVQGRCLRPYYYLDRARGETLGCARCATDGRTFSPGCRKCRGSVYAAVNLSFSLAASGHPVRLCLEAHVVRRSFWEELTSLRMGPFAAPRCRVVVMLRVREPTSWYASVYSWKVAGMRHNLMRTSGERVASAKYGRNFSDWVPHNLQVRILLHGSPDAGGPRYHRRSGETRLTSAELQKLTRLLSQPEHLVYPLEMLDVALVLLARLSGFVTPAYALARPRDRADTTISHRELHPCEVSSHECVEAVRVHAPDDMELYAAATEAFRSRSMPLLADPLFQAEVAAHRAAVAVLSQPPSSGEAPPARPPGCRGQPPSAHGHGRTRLDRRAALDGGGGETQTGCMPSDEGSRFYRVLPSLERKPRAPGTRWLGIERPVDAEVSAI